MPPTITEPTEGYRMLCTVNCYCRQKGRVVGHIGLSICRCCLTTENRERGERGQCRVSRTMAPGRVKRDAATRSYVTHTLTRGKTDFCQATHASYLGEQDSVRIRGGDRSILGRNRVVLPRLLDLNKVRCPLHNRQVWAIRHKHVNASVGILLADTGSDGFLGGYCPEPATVMGCSKGEDMHQHTTLAETPQHRHVAVGTTLRTNAFKT